MLNIKYIFYYTNIYKFESIFTYMKFKTKLTKIGGSYYFIVPKSIIDIYNMLKEPYIFEISVYNKGKILSYKNIGKEKQTKIDDFEKKDGK